MPRHAPRPAGTGRRASRPAATDADARTPAGDLGSRGSGRLSLFGGGSAGQDL